MPGQLRGVQIMRVGTWTGSAGDTEFTVGDLEEVVRSFYELSTQAGFNPHLKLGHAEAQAFFGQRSGFPSLGEVTRVWREGEFVYADFSNVPDVMLDLVAQRRYTQVSVELYPTYEFEGKKYRNVLVGVALLGAELPAVKGLRDLADALYKEAVAAFSEPQGRLEFTMPAQKTAEEIAREEAAAALQRTKDEAAAANKAAFDAQAARLQAVEAELERQRKVNAEAQVAAATAAFTASVDKVISEGRLLPKQKDIVLAFGTSLVANTTVIKFGEAEKSPLALFSEILAGLGKAVDFTEHGTGDTVKKPDETGKRAGQIVDERATALVSEKKAASYQDAVAIVLAADADLKGRYIAGQ